jgi:hypothetical protein
VLRDRLPREDLGVFAWLRQVRGHVAKPADRRNGGFLKMGGGLGVSEFALKREAHCRLKNVFAKPFYRLLNGRMHIYRRAVASRSRNSPSKDIPAGRSAPV